MKKKKTRKPLSKTKSKSLKTLAKKISPIRLFASMNPDYQATAPARRRGGYGVNIYPKQNKTKTKRPNPIKIFLS